MNLNNAIRAVSNILGFIFTTFPIVFYIILISDNLFFAS